MSGSSDTSARYGMLPMAMRVMMGEPKREEGNEEDDEEEDNEGNEGNEDDDGDDDEKEASENNDEVGEEEPNGSMRREWNSSKTVAGPRRWNPQPRG